MKKFITSLFVIAALALPFAMQAKAEDFTAKSLKLQTEMTEVLTTVKDKDTADKAAEKVSSIQKQMLELAKEVQKMTPEEMQAAVTKASADEKTMKKVQEIVTKLTAEMTRIGQESFYNSTSLIQAISAQ